MKKSVLLPYTQYLHLLQQQNHSDDLPTQNDGDNLKSKEPQDTNQVDRVPKAPVSLNPSKTDVIELLPQAVRAKALRLLNYLKEHNINWNKEGEVYVNNETPIKHSHICDILHFATTNTKRRPVGVQEVFESISNIPKSLLTNTSLTGGSSIPPGVPTIQRNIDSNSSWKTLWRPL